MAQIAPVAAIRERTGEKPPSIGSLYSAIERLEDRGLIKTRLGEATKERCIELCENGGDVKLGGAEGDSQSTCDRLVGGLR
jgi:DNA-binding MarR family transcriptional regulator